MSTFNGIIEEVAELSVDRFDGDNLKANCYLLSHIHTDHMKGIVQHGDRTILLEHLTNTQGVFIYCSNITAAIIANKYPELKPFVIGLSLNACHLIEVPSEQILLINVTLISAGHCPGSVMFLISTPDKKNILYTGDFRIDLRELTNIKALHSNDKPIFIDKMYFDSTFWSEKYSNFPKRQTVVDSVCDIINDWVSEEHEKIVYLLSPSCYGYEALYVDISEKLKMKLYVPDEIYKLYSCLADMDNIFTNDKSEAKVHCYCKRNVNLDENTRVIKLSAMYWTDTKLDDKKGGHEAESDQSFRVCYASHCSFQELKDFITYFRPVTIEGCVIGDESTRESIQEFLDSVKKNSGKRTLNSFNSCDKFKCDSEFSIVKKKKSNLYYLMKQL